MADSKSLSSVKDKERDEWQAPTVAPSTASVSDMEKDDGLRSDRETVRETEDAPAADETVRDDEKHNDLAKAPTSASQAGHSIKTTPTRDDGTEYPTGVKLGLISLALCLSVFLIALGMPHLGTLKRHGAFHTDNSMQTTLSLPQPFPRSPTSSTA